MEKLKTLGNQYFWLIVIVFLIFVGVMTHLIYQSWRNGAVDRTVSTQTNQANAAVKQAQTAANVAVNADIERRTEDAVREKTINPRRDEAQRKSRNSDAELQQARKTYNDKKNDTSNLSNSAFDNCRELERLYPDIQFQNCQP